MTEDLQDLKDKYVERSEDDMTDMKRSVQQGSFSGYNYVAEPAEGFDQRGAWIHFHANSRSGYAHVGMGLIHLMAEVMGIPIKLVPHRMIDIDVGKFPKDRAEPLKRYFNGAVGLSELLICVLPPLEASFLSGWSNALVPYITHEGLGCSQVMADLCNNKDVFPVVWCKSEFAKQAYMAGGVREERLRVLHPPIVGGPWTIPEPDLEFGKWPITEERPFVFGTVGTWHERKGFHDLVRAYYQAFEKRSTPVRLELRTSSLLPNETIPGLLRRVQADIAAIRDEDFKGRSYPTDFPQIRLHIGTKLSDAEFIAWLGDLDCYANASYGEGTGIPQVYAAAQGVPLISTAFGAVGELVVDMMQQRLYVTRGGGTHRLDIPNASPESIAQVHHSLVPHREEAVPLEMLRVNRIYSRDTQWGMYDWHNFSTAMAMMHGQGRRRDVIGSTVPRERHSMETVRPRLEELILEAADDGRLDEWWPK